MQLTESRGSVSCYKLELHVCAVTFTENLKPPPEGKAGGAGMESGIMFPPIPTCAGAGLCLRGGDDLPGVIPRPGARGLIYGAVKVNSLVFITDWVFFYPRKVCRRYLPSGKNPSRAEKPSKLLRASSSPQNTIPNPISHHLTPLMDPARTVLPKPTAHSQIPRDLMLGIGFSGPLLAAPR